MELYLSYRDLLEMDLNLSYRKVKYKSINLQYKFQVFLAFKQVL